MSTNNSILAYHADMGNMVKGDSYTCAECGLVLQVTKPCNEENCDLICCEKQMQKAA